MGWVWGGLFMMWHGCGVEVFVGSRVVATNDTLVGFSVVNEIFLLRS